MQRWIVPVVAAVLLVFGGGLFGVWTYKQNMQHPIWVPLPINPELPGDKRDEIVKHLKAGLESKEILLKISKDLDLPKKLKLPSDDAAADSLKRRLFVNSTDGNMAKGVPPTINIGVKGKNKEKEITGAIATRLMEDVWKILGIEPPPKK